MLKLLLSKDWVTGRDTILHMIAQDVNNGLGNRILMVPELIMDMEMAVVCTEDCKGLCPKCGKDLNEGECGCNRKEVDPRLACLAALLEKPE